MTEMRRPDAPLPEASARDAPQRTAPGLTARPLYQQVEAILRDRIVGRAWRPGELIPTEPDLATELGVSPGTVRRALAALERNHLIERRQGRGTFVAQQTSEQALGQFFRLRDLAGRPVTPLTAILSVGTGPATPAEAAALGLDPAAAVHRVHRSRRLDGWTRVAEVITLPAEIFPGLALPLSPARLEVEIYVHYRRAHGIIVVRAEEAMAARGATADEARALGLEEGIPVLEVARLAYDAAGRAVERRVTVIDTAAHRYAVGLE